MPYIVSKEARSYEGMLVDYSISNPHDKSLIGFVSVDARGNFTRWTYFNENMGLLFKRTHQRQINGMRNAVLDYLSRPVTWLR